MLWPIDRGEGRNEEEPERPFRGPKARRSTRIRLPSTSRPRFLAGTHYPITFMKIRLLTFTLICAFVAALGLQAEEKEAETELGKKMEKMSGAFRRLTRQIKDSSKNEDSLKQIAIIRENAEASAKLEPDLKKEIPSAKQAKFVADYRAKMKSFLADLGKLEAAIKAGNNAEAESLLATVKKAQKDGHTDFKKDKKKK